MLRLSHAVLLVLGLASGACHGIFGYRAVEGETPADAGPADGGDGAAPDAAVPDAPREAGTETAPAPARLACDPPQLIPSVAELVEPAIRLDRLTLLGRVRNTDNDHSQSTRAAVDAPWGPWEPFGRTTPTMGDLAAFAGPDDKEWLVGTTSGSPRVPTRCISLSSAPSKCRALELSTVGGARLDGDIDGPMIATTMSGGYVLTLNAQELLLLATPLDAELISWRAVTLSALGSPTDDATFTPGARFIIYQVPSPDGGELWFATWDPASDRFVAPQLLPGIGGEAAGPSVAPSDGLDDFELFVHSGRSGGTQIHATRCVVTR